MTSLHRRVLFFLSERKIELHFQIESLNRLLTSHTSTASKLFNATIKQQQIEADLKRVQKELNSEKWKSRMLIVKKRKQMMENLLVCIKQRIDTGDTSIDYERSITAATEKTTTLRRGTVT